MLIPLVRDATRDRRDCLREAACDLRATRIYPAKRIRRRALRPAADRSALKIRPVNRPVKFPVPGRSCDSGTP